MRIYVTGACGFIGSHTVDALRSDGHEVLACDDLSRPAVDRVPTLIARAEHVTGIQFEAAVHLAAIVNARHLDPSEVWRTNLDALSRTLVLSDGAPVVFASSAAANRPDSSPYAASKRAGEHLALSHDATVLRFANVYGERQQTPAALATWQQQADRGEPVTVFGGDQTRDFVPVATVVEAIRAAIRSDDFQGEIVDVCTGEQRRVIDVAREIADPRGVPVRVLPAVPGEPRAIHQDPSRLYDLLAAA